MSARLGPAATRVNTAVPEPPRLFVLPIAFGQLAAGLLILCPLRRAVRAGLAGGIVVLVAITPLGLGSAFPSPLLFAAAVALLMRPVRGGTA